MASPPHRLSKAKTRLAGLSERIGDWLDQQDPASLRGVAISGWRCYRRVDGPLQSALLSLYVLVAVLPALLVLEAYLDAHPNALANSLVHHYHLSGVTASLFRTVLVEGRAHELGAALLAIAGSLFFGLGFGRVLQLVNLRAWQLDVPAKQTDQALYAVVLLALYGLLLLLLVQLTELEGAPGWVGTVLGVGWAGLLTLFFVWMPWRLTHKLVAPRNLVPGAIATSVGLVVLMLLSNRVMQFWVDFYAKDYGGLGVFLAIYFWIAFSSAVIVIAASFSPAFAERRRLRRSRRV